MPELIARPITSYHLAREIALEHPHAKAVPRSIKYCIAGYLDGRLAGFAGWGYGVMPRVHPRRLFGEAGRLSDYLELTRFFVYDWCPPNTASRFLSATHRIIKRWAPHVKWLFTYAAAFLGLVGTIYQAANYEYIGRFPCKSFIYIPGIGLIHSVSLWHRYGKQIGGASGASLRRIRQIFPDARRWCGYNFAYIYWLCDKREKERLMQHARFAVQPYPTKDDVEIWLDDGEGNRERVSVEFARTVNIVPLPSAGVRAGD